MSSSTSPTTTSPDDPTCSSSVETIRGFPSELTIAIADVSGIGFDSRPETPPADPSSRPSSPHSSWPSPSSPSGESVSSFPSVSSSFLLSSNPETPPHIDLDLATHQATSFRSSEDPHELIIPSLILPSLLKQPTQHGKALGEVKLVILSNSHRSSEQVLRVFTDEECDEFVDIGRWEELSVDCAPGEIPSPERSKVMRLSTDWLEHRDAHGLERYEAARNVELVHLPEFSIAHNPAEVIRSALRVIHTPFHVLHSVLKTEYPPNNLLASLLASSTSPLYTALILSLDGSPSPYENALIKELSPHIPLIVLLPPPAVFGLSGPPGGRYSEHTSTLRPRSALDFRTSLLQSHETVSTLRLEAADRFLRWREVERSVQYALNSGPEFAVGKALQDWKLRSGAADLAGSMSLSRIQWDKARWEAEWEGSLSSDVSKTLRQRRAEGRSHVARRPIDRRLTVTSKTRAAVSVHPLTASPVSSPSPLPASERSESSGHKRRSSLRGETFVRNRHSPDIGRIPFDPLHFPSIIAFSYSLLSPLRARLAETFSISSIPSLALPIDKGSGSGLSVGFLIGAFCAGLGFGFAIARFRP